MSAPRATAAPPASRLLVRTIDDMAAWSVRRAPNITFVGPDPHYGIGLEGLCHGYGIACIDATPAVRMLQGDGVDVLALGAASAPAARPHAADASASAGAADGDPNGHRPATAVQEGADGVERAEGADGHSASAVISSARGAAWLRARAMRDHGRLPLLVFKTSHRLETIAVRNGWRLLCAPAALGRGWENKITFRARAEALGLRQPPGRVVSREAMDYDALAAALGERLVVQAPYGYAGMQSHRVDSPAAMAAALRAARSPEWRVTGYVAGTPLSVNACVTTRGVAVGAPFLQLTGLADITPYPLGSCGQDWAILPQLDVDAAGVVRLAEVIGAALAADGYRGIFGVDAVQGDDGEMYAIEVNPRLIASIALFTQLEIADGRLPLLARHVLAHLDPDADDAPLDLHRAPLSGAQVVLHNVGNAAFKVRDDVACGAWPLPASNAATPPTSTSGPRESHSSGPRESRRPGAGGSTLSAMPSIPAYRVDHVPIDHALALMPAPGRGVAPGGAHARVQIRGRGVASADGALQADVAAFVRRVQRAVGAPHG